MRNPLWAFIRRVVRRHTFKIPEEPAVVWKKRLAIGYMLVGWNAFGLVVYLIFTGRQDWAKTYGYKQGPQVSPAVEFAHILHKEGEKKPQVFRISGFAAREIPYEFEETSNKTQTEKTEDGSETSSLENKK